MAKSTKTCRTLRGFAKKEETGANLEQRFEARKTTCVKKLTVHYQKIKANKTKDPNKEQVPKYLIALGKITMAVKRLSYSTLDDTEQTINLDELEDEDLTDMDKPVVEDGTQETESESSEQPTTSTSSELPKKPLPPVPQKTTKPTPTTNGPSTAPQVPSQTPPQRPQTPAPPLSPRQLKDKAAKAHQAAEIAKTKVADAKKKVADLAVMVERRQRMGEHDNKTGDTQWQALQFSLVTQRVDAQKEAERLEELAGKLEAEAAKARVAHQKLIDEQAFASLDKGEAMLIKSTQTLITQDKQQLETAKNKADTKQGDLENAIYLPRESEKTLKKSQDRVTNLERLIKDEKGRVILPRTKKSKLRDETVKEYEEELVEAKKKLTEAEKANLQAKQKATFIVGTETKLRATAVGRASRLPTS